MNININNKQNCKYYIHADNEMKRSEIFLSG